MTKPFDTKSGFTFVVDARSADGTDHKTFAYPTDIPLALVGGLCKSINGF